MMGIINVIKSGGAEEEAFIKKLLSRCMLDDENIVQSTEKIISDVKQKGDESVIEYTWKFDHVKLNTDEIKVSKHELNEAHSFVDCELKGAIRQALKNVNDFHMKQKENSWIQTGKHGTITGQIIRPLDKVGVYVPGGTAPLISTVLMNVVPAKVAGVNDVYIATPPYKDGKINPAILFAANEAGVDNIYKIGGAQAIAAFAFGTKQVPKVDKIVGPGNIYVALAKKLVFGYCDIDMIAGPSEIAIIADDSSNARFLAADLLSQAEHDIMASAILLTSSQCLAEKVCEEVERQCSYLERRDIIEKSLKSYGAIIIVEKIEEAIELANKIAPEHLEICTDEPFAFLSSVKNAGAIFLGQYSSEPVGDYYAGPSHVLPTGGTARFFSPLSVDDFIKKSSIVSYSKTALYESKDDIVRLAAAEGLTAHANAIEVRCGCK